MVSSSFNKSNWEDAMNDTLEAFRKRLRGPKKQKANWQFWIGSPTAWLALVLSFANAFYSLIYHSDELRVIPSRIQFVVRTTEIGIRDIGIPRPDKITFINSGSRPIAILGLTMELIQPPSGVDDTKLHCRSGFGVDAMDAMRTLTFDQLVVKQYEVVTREVKFDQEDGPRVSFVEMNERNQQEWVPSAVLCLVVSFVTVDGKYSRIIELQRIGSTGIIVAKGPHYLVKQNTFRTEVGSDELDARSVPPPLRRVDARK
jgi:hypothetical protein